MRVSLPICIASCLLVVVLSWWLSTRSRDFMVTPDQAELERIRLAAAQTNPTAQGMGDALSPSSSGQDQAPIPVILPEHVANAPQLDDYLNEAKHGPDYLVDLAELLKKDHPERALSCWERILDSSKAGNKKRLEAAEQVATLKKSIIPWNDKPENGIIVIIQAGTGPTTAALLEPILEQVGSELQKASSGIITFETKVSAGEEDIADEGMAPVALWMSGPTESSASTDILSFTTPVDSMDGLDARVKRSIYRIIRLHLKGVDNIQPLPKLVGQNSPDKLLEGHITRMVWKWFAESLQTIQ